MNNVRKNIQKGCQILDWPNISGNTNLQDTGVWVNPGRDGWRIFEGGTGSTLPMPCCKGNDELKVNIVL